MAKQQYLDYTIHLSDKELVVLLNTNNPNGVRIAPGPTGTYYGAPLLIGNTFPNTVPCLRSPFFGNESKYPTNQTSFETCSGGWFGICFLFGSRTRYTWVGRYVYAPPPEDPPTVDGVPAQDVAIATRRFVEGFEFASPGEMVGGSDSNFRKRANRDASRHIDGFGVPYRGEADSHTISYANFGSLPRSAWERIYVRPRKLPTGDVWFWRNTASTGGSHGSALGITSTGQIVLTNTPSSPSVTDTTTTALQADTWYKLDIVWSFASAAAGVGASFKLYINGVAALSKLYTANSGQGSLATTSSTEIGSITGAANTLEMDFDDYIGAEPPSADVGGSYVGKDWQYGSRVVGVRPTGFGPATTASDFSQGYRSISSPAVFYDSSTAINCSVSGAILSLTTDADRTVDGLENSVGMAAMAIAMYADPSSTLDGQLGFSIAGGPLQMSTVDLTVSAAWEIVRYNPVGVITPPKVHPLEIRFVNAATTSTIQIAAIGAAVEVLGVFGPEDVVGTPIPTFLPRAGIHNCHYPTTAWAKLGTAPQSPVVIHSGTYTGNETGQDLYFRVPVNWMFIRAATASQGPNLWWSSMIGSHKATLFGSDPAPVIRAEVDPDYVGAGGDNDNETRYKISIAGGAAAVNDSGVVYQYVAVCDPGMRFMLNGAFKHLSGTVNTDPLLNEDFTPFGAFFQRDTLISLGTAGATWFRGPGHVNDEASPLDDAVETGVATFSAGSIESGTRLNSSVTTSLTSVAYSAWRLDDNSSDSGKTRVVQMFTYTGNGTGARTVAITPASGRRPMFAIVCPHNNDSYWRDPTHTANLSSLYHNGSTSTSAITGGGIDEIVVGSTLNASGIVYTVFVIPGGIDACEGGWSCNGEFIPVEPDSPFDGPWQSPPADDEETTDPDNPSDDPTADDEPISAPGEFEFQMESARSRAIRLSNLCQRILHRLGDTDQKIWQEDEIDRYIAEAALEMADRTKLVWDQLYLENIPPGFHHTSEFEADLLDYEFQYGYASYNHSWEGQYGFDDGLWNEEDVQWAEHTSPADVPFLSEAGISEQRGTAEIPKKLVAIERVAWDQRDTPGLDAREMAAMDTRYEITQGEMYGFTLEYSNPRVFRKIRIPNVQANTNQHDGSWGIARDTTTAYAASMTGTWGVPRIVPGYHPMGDTAGYGIPRRFYLDTLNTKVEYWRKFGTACEMSELMDGVAQRLAGELPRRYFLYIADYAQWKALVRKGPGQDFKLAQLYKDRWERDIQRIINRVNRRQKERLSRMGGADPSPRGGPPRPRLPWQYGKRIR